MPGTFSQVGTTEPNLRPQIALPAASPSPLPAAPQVPSQSVEVPAATSEDQMIQELQQSHQKMAEQMEMVNVLEPTAALERLKAAKPESLTPQLKTIQGFLQNKHVGKRVERFAEIAKEPAFQAASKEVLANPNLRYVYVGLVAIALFHALLKKRALAATDRWFLRLVLRLGLFGVWVVATVGMAYLILGGSILTLLWGFWRIAVLWS